MRMFQIPHLSALMEILLLFSPAIPAYLWLWPSVANSDWYLPVQIATYLYFITGTLFIGLRRWNLTRLGLNCKGVRVSLLCGFSILLGRNLTYLATNMPVEPKMISIVSILGDIFFYFGLVGFTEELLFRGLIYRALEDWHGARLAIWGSAIAFGLYHLGSQGALGAFGTAILGLLFAVIRWRSGGIAGLVITHGLIDLVATQIQPSLELVDIHQIRIQQPGLLLLGYIFLLGPLIYLWKFYPTDNP